MGSKRIRWTDDLITQKLAPYVRRYGRMPSANELRKHKENPLAVIISRRGGYVAWAAKLGVALKGTATHRGQQWERHEATYFRRRGWTVEPQSTKAPFDLLVNGVRVDVKSALWHEYGVSRGYFFAGVKRGVDCDVLDLVCHDGTCVLARFIVPTSAGVGSMITITPLSLKGDGRFASYKNNFSPLVAAALLPVGSDTG